MKKILTLGTLLFFFFINAINSFSVQAEELPDFDLTWDLTEGQYLNVESESGTIFEIADPGLISLIEQNGAVSTFRANKAGMTYVHIKQPTLGKFVSQIIIKGSGNADNGTPVDMHHYSKMKDDDRTKKNTVNFAERVLELSNQERSQRGIEPLRLAADLMDGAAIRAEEITTVFSHTRPNGKPCHSLFKDGMYMIGENIAAGSATPEAVVDQWMNSSGHRANILNADYKELGVGYVCKSGTQYMHYWVQMFRRPMPQVQYKVFKSRGGKNYHGEVAVSDTVFLPNINSSSGNVYTENSRSVEAYPEEVLKLVNKERAKVGARPLRLSDELMAGAKIRAEEITMHFAHERPDGKSCFTVLRNRNCTLGENIAAGSVTPKAVVDQWMHSARHRANILNKDFKELGVGYCYKERSEYRHYWIQMFKG